MESKASRLFGGKALHILINSPWIHVLLSSFEGSIPADEGPQARQTIA